MHTEDYGWVEEAPGSSNYINPAIVAVARRIGAKTALDAGCGNGALSGALAEAGLDVLGVDADGKGVEIATRRYPGARFEVGVFGGPPARTDQDLVVSTEVVEHLYSPHELSQYCFAALKPGGVIAISTPYHGYLKNLALALTNAWDKHHTADWHGGHIKFWSRKTLGKLLEDAGFEVTGFIGVGRLPYLWKSMILLAKKPA
jgi:2-polyprenyl-3-methyl-5-hydroxy-6-metoxy-1,4-benzoquinol methylase